MIKTYHLKHFYFFEHPHVAGKYKCLPHTNRIQFLIIIGEDCLQITGKGVVQENSFVVHCAFIFQPQENILQYKAKSFRERDKTEII